MRKLSKRMDAGQVKAKLNNGEIVTVLKRKTPGGVATIIYNKDGIPTKSTDYKLLDEIIEK